MACPVSAGREYAGVGRELGQPGLKPLSCLAVNAALKGHSATFLPGRSTQSPLSLGHTYIGILPIDRQTDLEDYSRVLLKRFNEEALWGPRIEANPCVSCLAF
jgi:hypothetical protein